MPKYKFGDLVYNITEKRSPVAGDEELYIGLEHLDSGSLRVTRWGSKVALKGDKLVMRKGDILFGRRNTYLRRVAIAPHDGLFSAHGMILRAKTERINSEYLPFFIASDYFMDEAIRISVGSLSPTVNWKELKELEFTIPTLEEQEKLVKTLLAANDLKEKYEELLAITDDLVKSQFIELFGDPILNEKGWPSKSIKESAVRLSDGPFGSNLKSEHYSETGVRVIRLQNICEGYFLDDDKAYVSLEHYEKIKKYTCKSGEIIIGTLGEPNLRACIIPEYIGYAINKADCVHYIPNPEYLDTAFVVGFLNSPIVLNYALGDAHGNTRQRISSGQISKMPIIIPPMELQKQYAVIIQQTDKSKYYEQNRVFSVTRGGELCA